MAKSAEAVVETARVRSRDTRMSFAELGEEFMRSVLTSDLLRREFIASIPPGGLDAVETIDGFEVEYRGEILSVGVRRNGVTRLHPQPALHGYRFHFSAGFRVALTVKIAPGLRESFELHGTLPLTLEAQAYRPLEIFVSFESLREDLIELRVEKGQWHDLALRFGKLEDKVRRKVAERVNAILAGNESQRSVNLLEMVQGALAARASARITAPSA